jgi:GAF domain-containing protein
MTNEERASVIVENEEWADFDEDGYVLGIDRDILAPLIAAALDAAEQRGAAMERARIVAYLDEQAQRLRSEPPIMPKEARVLSTVAAAIRATAEP